MSSRGASGEPRSSRPEAPAANASAPARSAAPASRAFTSMRAKLAVVALLGLVAMGPAGCYLAHLASGQTRLLLARQPVDALRADPATPHPLRERFEDVAAARRFAAELGLEVEDQYTSFVDAPGRGIITSVVATRPGEIEAEGFWFPFVGRLPYKGFFDPERAEREAEALRAEGRDVCVSAIPAYSTLGWFDDPLTGPMLRMSRSRLIETVFHELVHATVYAPGDADWSEALATFVGQEAAVRFAETRHGAAGPEARRERVRVEEQRRLAGELARFRGEVRRLYQETPYGPARVAAREALERETRARIEALAFEVLDAPKVAERVRLNDACQALSMVYQADLVPLEARLAALGGDLPALIREAREAAAAGRARAWLDGVRISESGTESNTSRTALE